MGKHSFARQISLYVSVFILLILLASAALQYFNARQNDSFLEGAGHLFEKEKLVTELQMDFDQVLLDLRGKMDYHDPKAAGRLQTDQTQIKVILKRLSEIQDTRSDAAFLDKVDESYSYFFNEPAPGALSQTEAGDRGNSNLGEITSRMSSLQKLISDYRAEITEGLESHIQTFPEKERKGLWAFLVFLSFVIIVLLIIIRSSFVRLGIPLKSLAVAAEDISQGKEMEALDTARYRGEIGVLAGAFEKMIRSIQEKEQNLVAQNEELIAQQDELQAQQEELREALLYKEAHEQILERRNRLINALSNTLDRSLLLESIVQNLAFIMNAHKGIIILLDHEDYASFGVSEKGVGQFFSFLHESFLVRVRQTGKTFLIERDSSSLEKSYHDYPMKSSDVIIPIFSSTEEIVAVMLFTRAGSLFSEKEVEEFDSLAKQIALSLDRLKFFEETLNQRRLTNEIVNTIREGVQLVDASGIVTEMNTQLRSLLGIEFKDQEPLVDWLSGLSEKVENCGKLAEFMNRVITEQSAEGSGYIYKTAGPKTRIINLYYEPLYREERKIGTVFVHQDITKQYEVDQMKSEFVSTVSHELRTPLSSILGFSEVMLNKELQPERKKKYLTAIYQEAKRLTSLINDFLDVQRMEAGRQTYERRYLNIIPLIEQVMEAQKINTAIHRFEMVQLSEQTIVLGDRDKLLQVFNNVIGNAVKYSPDGGNVTVTVYEEGQMLHVEIQDEGLGIPAEAVDKLFTKFFRIDNSDRRKIGGTGLGLSIVKGIMDAHDGKITVRSEMRSGSTFCLSFPSAHIESAPPGDIPESQKQGIVLVLEDDLNLVTLLQNELEQSGFFTQIYHRGETALEDVKRKLLKPDALVVDIRLAGGMNGWEFISRIRREAELDSIPIVISSALEEKEQGRRLGIDGYLVKPYEPGQLTNLILQTLLRKKKDKESLEI